MKNKTKLMTLICIYSFISVTSVIAGNIDAVVNQILRTNGAIFLRTSEKFLPNKMEYFAADSNGNALKIEGHSVKLIFTGIANFHGEFIPAKTFFSQSEHKFVGHAEIPVEAGSLIVEIGDNKKSYQLRDHDEVIEDTIIVNNSIYKICIEFTQSLLKEVLFKNDSDKTKAMTYFIAIDGIEWISYTPEYNEEMKLMKEELELTKATLVDCEEKANRPREKTQREKILEYFKKNARNFL